MPAPPLTEDDQPASRLERQTSQTRWLIGVVSLWGALLATLAHLS